MAATLTVWKFDNAFAAKRAETKLLELEKEKLITIHDAVVVSWPTNAKKPNTDEMYSSTKDGARGGAFWGLLIGLVFFVPLFGALIGGAAGALSGSMRDIGIDDDFINSVRGQVTPGTSALFVMSSDAVVDKVKEAFADQEMELLATSLAGADEEALREVFGS